MPNVFRGPFLASSLALASACAQAPLAPSVPIAADRQLMLAALRTRTVDQVSPGVYVARGYGLATSTMLVGPEGRVIIDTMESPEAARDVRSAFDAINDKPIRAIIYTHGHPDHTSGTVAFTDGRAVPIYAHAKHFDLVAEQATAAGTVYRQRAIRQFGLALPSTTPTHLLRVDVAHVPVPVPPTRTFPGESLILPLAGLNVALIHAPGESMDQIAVWLPAAKVLVAADDVYPSFPNLYTLRGEPSRDVLRWRSAVLLLRDLNANVLISGHGPALTGADTIRDTLQAYADAILFVHDQTLRWANDGLGPDDIVARVRLPPVLANHPWLQESYGRVEWGVRAVYQHYFGFFDGDAAHLRGMSSVERAQHLTKLAGGEPGLHRALVESQAARDWLWTAELATALITLHPDDVEARHAKSTALEELARNESSMNAVNYLLTSAAEVRGDLKVRDPTSVLSREYVRTLPLSRFFHTMATRLHAEDCLDRDEVAGFRFPDAKEEWTIHIHHGVAEVRPEFPAAPALTITIDAQVWKEMLLGMRSSAITMSTKAQIDGGLLKARSFLMLFQSQ